MSKNKNETAIEKPKSIFETLSAVNCNGHTEKKNGLTYLSWAWAWQMVKSLYPSATYKIYESADGCFYHTDGSTCWVKTGVTIEYIEMVEYLPVMDFRNASIPKAKVTSFDVNKAIQRSLTKACARHGLGLYIYAGEDLPESSTSQEAPSTPQEASAPKTEATTPPTTKKAPARVQGAKKAASKKMVDAWKLYASTEAAKALSDTQRGESFRSLCKAITGEADPYALTDDQWDAVIAEITAIVGAA